jgi:glycosyltransferase involved in cell wall biosynthesis
LRELVFAVPGDLATPTGGYEYARRLLEHLPEHGIAVTHLALPGSFPAPDETDLAAVARSFAALPDRVPLLADGLAYGALPREVIAAAGERPILALVHHPLGMEEGLSRERAEALLASEKAALALAARVVVTSQYTARLLAERFGVSPDRIHVARPGTEVPKRRALSDRVPRPSPSPGVVHLLAVGAVTPRKGYDVLLEALAGLVDAPWHLTIVGALDRAPDHVGALRKLVERRLGRRVTMVGTVSAGQLDRHYRNADALVSASLFEGYGMTLAEGLARGLPIVMARAGAADETVPDAAALKVAPGDVAALAEALRRVVAEPDLRSRLASTAREAGRSLPRWRDTAAAVAGAIPDGVS